MWLDLTNLRLVPLKKKKKRLVANSRAHVKNKNHFRKQIFSGVFGGVGSYFLATFSTSIWLISSMGLYTLWFYCDVSRFVVFFYIILFCNSLGFFKQSSFFQVFQTRTVHWTVKIRGSRFLRSNRSQTRVEPWWCHN